MLPVVNQLLLVLVVSSLTVMLVLSGIQVLKLLSELRKTLKKVDQVVDDTSKISSSVAKPVVSASNFVMGIKSGVDLVNLIAHIKSDKNKKNDGESE